MAAAGVSARVADYHVHSRFSDGEGEPAELVERALALGLPAIGFADHFTPAAVDDQGGYGLWRADLDDYVTAVRAAAAGCPEMTVLLGVEADYLPEAEAELAEVEAAYPLDYMLCGIHFVDGFSFDDTPNRDDGRWRDAGFYCRYYGLVRRAMETGLFDILAHIDYIHLWGHPVPGDISAAENDALVAIAAAGAALEVNTTGLLDVAARMYPLPDLLARAHERRVPLVFGSDAHALDQVGWCFDDGVALARGAGYASWRELPSHDERPFD